MYPVYQLEVLGIDDALPMHVFLFLQEPTKHEPGEKTHQKTLLEMLDFLRGG